MGDLRTHRRALTLESDILAALKGDASRGSDVAPVNSDGWESKVCDRRHWQCHATDTRPRRGVASYLVVLCRSARSAHCFDFGSRRGKHRVNCQFSAHIPGYDAMGCEPSPCTVKVNEGGRCIPALKREVLAPCTAVHKLESSRVHRRWLRSSRRRSRVAAFWTTTVGIGGHTGAFVGKGIGVSVA